MKKVKIDEKFNAAYHDVQRCMYEMHRVYVHMQRAMQELRNAIAVHDETKQERTNDKGEENG